MRFYLHPGFKNQNIAKTLEPRHDKMCLREFPTRPDINRPAQPLKLASLEILAIDLEILYYLSSEQQRRWSDGACAGWSAPLLFAYDLRHIFSWPGSLIFWNLDIQGINNSFRNFRNLWFFIKNVISTNTKIENLLFNLHALHSFQSCILKTNFKSVVNEIYQHAFKYFFLGFVWEWSL